MIVVTVAEAHEKRSYSFTRDEVLVGGDEREVDLVLSRDGVAPRHLRLSVRDGVVRVHDFVLGQSIASPIEPEDVVLAGPVELNVKHVPLVPEFVKTDAERGFLEQIRARPDDPEPRSVYADWLDENREPERAEFLRLQLAAQAATSADDPAYTAIASRLWEVALFVGDGWRTLVATSFIDVCPARPRYEHEKLANPPACPKRWDRLSPTEEPGERSCGACGKTVTYCLTIDHARVMAQSGHCIAVDAFVLRHAFDLESFGGSGNMFDARPFSRYGRRR